MANSNYNPDVLNCIANLSNDEVFTPPELANKVLDLLPQELFSNPKSTFLDPFSKSGVFLREIVKRLDRGLESLIPDRQERIDHILHTQVYGIAITELTSYLSRRSLYCSKHANGKYSVSHFNTESGNILYANRNHTWVDGKCKYCGASQQVYDRGSEAEQYAYMFIHTDNPKQFFGNMKFDVIIGNPPYQLADGSGGSSDSAVPIYNKFIEQAIKLSPRYLTMIIPSKWMVGGRGLNKFRERMMNDCHLRQIHDYEDSSKCFPGIHLDGGVCYFLWDSKYDGDPVCTFEANDGSISTLKHSLKNSYFGYVIRDNRVITILDKISDSSSFSDIVSSVRPYGIRGYLFNEPERYPNSKLSHSPFKDSIHVFGVKGIKGGARRTEGYVTKETATVSTETINQYKIFFTTSYSTNAVIPPDVILGKPGDICTETFLLVGPFSSEKEQMNCKSYIETSFFRFLLYFGKGTMHVTKEVFGLIPLLDFSHPWTDEMLYKKYSLTKEEINFIESMIRPME
ncbi:MAG: Eco57I restriction-modification methylase domain-containing protein [Bacteroidales bacterium]|nr:Eco57I restriction-modification methylase domain-containing protein [Bacteroidales bacterium]